MKRLNTVLVMLAALAAFGPAQAADTGTACRLRGGSIVPLPAEACAKEGGAMVTVTMVETPAPAAQAASAPAEVLPLSADPKRAAAQKAIIELLRKPVVSRASGHNGPESIERTAKFDECRLTVNEDMHLDYGNLVSARENFKIESAVDFRALSASASGILGEVSSKGGDLEAYAVSLEAPSPRAGNAISISVSAQEKSGYRKFVAPDTTAYWAGPRYDYWMADQYGYPRADDMGRIYKNRVRILFVVATSGDASALKKAFDDLHAACSP